MSAVVPLADELRRLAAIAAPARVKLASGAILAAGALLTSRGWDGAEVEALMARAVVEPDVLPLLLAVVVERIPRLTFEIALEDVDIRGDLVEVIRADLSVPMRFWRLLARRDPGAYLAFAPIIEQGHAFAAAARERELSEARR